MPLLWLLGFGAWAFGLYIQITYVVLPAAVASVVVFALVVVWFYLRAVWDVLTDRTRSGIATPPFRQQDDRSGPEPAFLAYPLRQIWIDLWQIVRDALESTRDGARSAIGWVRQTVDISVGGWSTIGIVALVLLPTSAALVFGAAAGVLAGLAAYVGIVLATAALMLVLAVVWALVWLALAAVEGLFRLWRRIRQSCPYAGCYRRIALPTYECPRCGQRHRRIAPNEYGLLRHDCRCGAALPTAIVLGRHRMTALCPHCNRPLPQRVGRVPVVTVPVVGGPAAGKTTFLCLAVSALHTRLNDVGAAVGFAEPAQERVFSAGRRQLREGGVLDKTVQRMPDGVMLDVGIGGRSDRILYLFDPAGESYAAADGVEAQGYLDHAEGLIIVVDPFAVDAVVRSLTQAERDATRTVAGPVGTAEAQPEGVVGRLFDLLRSRSGATKLRRIAVVVSKTDALEKTAIGRSLGADGDVQSWLNQVGWGNNVRLLEQNATEVGYFNSALDLADDRYLEPLQWLAGISVNGNVQPPKENPPLEPKGDKVTVPHGYRLGRGVTLVTSLTAGVAATTLAAGGIIGGITGAFDESASPSTLDSSRVVGRSD
ncbi:MAG: hypothetical protein GEV28_11655 [Actinophytocola sp.]|uniref:TRAFAC clade GTPase domain-containing protein n=1 Tax=Actinophytocola sp. TaxID=1872138 RepID=UPI00132389F9|nr:hypothetical protein [Actinophytocola sp.]MPZ81010.1 hypothetical protein [Actinophytocola sp.]